MLVSLREALPAHHLHQRGQGRQGQGWIGQILSRMPSTCSATALVETDLDAAMRTDCSGVALTGSEETIWSGDLVLISFHSVGFLAWHPGHLEA